MTTSLDALLILNKYWTFLASSPILVRRSLQRYWSNLVEKGATNSYDFHFRVGTSKATKMKPSSMLRLTSNHMRRNMTSGPEKGPGRGLDAPIPECEHDCPSRKISLARSGHFRSRQ